MSETPEKRALETAADAEAHVQAGLWSLTVPMMQALCDWAEGAMGQEMHPLSGDHRPRLVG